MTVLQCTLAPWSLDENDSRDEAQSILSDRTGEPVGEAYLGHRGGECEANARVMAAAPELYQALRDALPLVRHLLEVDLRSGCLLGPDGKADRATADMDFRETLAACDHVIAIGEAALDKANGVRHD